MAVEIERPRRLFTVDEYHRMAEAGVFGPEERVELIEGEIVEMAPINPRHAGCVINVNRLLITRLGDRTVVSPQNPVVSIGDIKARSRKSPRPPRVSGLALAQLQRGQRACQGDFGGVRNWLTGMRDRSGPERTGLGVRGARMALRR